MERGEEKEIDLPFKVSRANRTRRQQNGSGRCYHNERPILFCTKNGDFLFEFFCATSALWGETLSYSCVRVVEISIFLPLFVYLSHVCTAQQNRHEKRSNLRPNRSSPRVGPSHLFIPCFGKGIDKNFDAFVSYGFLTGPFYAARRHFVIGSPRLLRLKCFLRLSVKVDPS